MTAELDRWVAEQVEQSRTSLNPGTKKENRTLPDQEERLITLVGVVGSNPETKTYTGKDGPSSLVTFRLAVNTSYQPGSEARWFDVAVFNDGLKESTLHQVYKGAKIGIEGFYSLRQVGDKSYDNIRAQKIGLVEWLAVSKRQAAPAPAAPAIPAGMTPEMFQAFQAFAAAQKASPAAAPVPPVNTNDALPF